MIQIYNYPRPTTGFVSIYWLLNYCNCKVTITAFDFFKTKNRYTMEDTNHIGTPKGYNQQHLISLKLRIDIQWKIQTILEHQKVIIMMLNWKKKLLLNLFKEEL